MTYMSVTFELFGGNVTAHKWAEYYTHYSQGDLDLKPYERRALSDDQIQRLRAHHPDYDGLNVVLYDGDAVLTEERVVVSARNLDPPARVDTVERINVRASDIEPATSPDGFPYAKLDGRPASYNRHGADDVVSLWWNVPSGQDGQGGAFDFTGLGF